MTKHTTIDSRLAAALTVVAAHGIAVRRASGDLATGTHGAMIRAELAARYPAGLGSYVLYAAGSDSSELHCSDASVADAVAAACRASGIDPERDGTVITARATAPAPRRSAAASPWRWLGARPAPVTG